MKAGEVQSTIGSAGQVRTGIGGMGPNAGRSGSRAHQNLMPRARPTSSAPIATVLVADVARDIAHH